MAKTPALNLIAEEDNIICDVNGKMSFIKVRQTGTVRIGTADCSQKAFIGKPFGTAFLLDESRQLVVTGNNPLDDIETATGTERTNANLLAGGAQQYSEKQVAQMKLELSGTEMLDALETGSSTFAAKTEFSQEKWRKKKAKKYIQYVTARQPTAQLICQAYFTKMPSKVFNLRPDTLAIMTGSANVGPYARVLCVDATGGILAASCVERMGGFGSLCCVHAEPKRYSFDVVRQLNTPPLLARSTRHVTLEDLLLTQQRVAADDAADAQRRTEQPATGVAASDDAAAVPASAPGDAATTDAAAAVASGSTAGADTTHSTPADTPAAEAPSGRAASGGAGAASSTAGGKTAGTVMEMHLHEEPVAGRAVPDRMMPANEGERLKLVSQGFSSLVVACPRVEYTSLLTALLPMLRPSASVSLFSPSLQPLVECYTFLKATHQFIAVTVAESWWREQQVLPSRTHPMMSMPGTGGYVLTAIRVAASTGGRRGGGGKRGGSGAELYGSARPAKRQRN